MRLNRTGGPSRGAKRSPIDEALQILRERSTTSRMEIAQVTGLSRATISDAVGELVHLGLVSEIGTQETAKGRPPTMLQLSPDSVAVIGAELSDHHWAVGAFDLVGSTIAMQQFPVHAEDPEQSIQRLVAAISEMAATLPRPPLPIVGIGSPGYVNLETGTVVSAADLGWNEVPLQLLVGQGLGWPTAVLNRHQARGLAECRFGHAKASEKVTIYIGIGTGVAAGLYLDGRLFPGAHGGAGEIGHTIVDADGPLCPCGNRGCLWTLISEPAVVQEMRRRIREGNPSSLARISDVHLLTVQQICDAVAEEDQLAMDVVRHQAQFLGLAMANLVNTLNPTAIVLGGDLARHCPLWIEAATQAMHQRAMKPLARDVTVRPTEMEAGAGAMGAAAYALDRFLTFETLSEYLTGNA